MGASQAVILDFSNRDSIQMAGGLLIPQTGWLIPFNQWEKYSKIRPTLGERNIVAISAALAVKKEVIDKIGGFDEKEAIYTEDLDFCWRIWLAGYRIVLAPNSCVFHWTKSVDARSGMKASYKQIYFHLAKNSFRSIIKNYEVINILKYLPVSIFINIGRGFIFLLSKRKSDALAGSLESIMWLFSNLSDTIRKRREVQRERRFSDKFLMEKIFLNENLINVYNKHFK
jgi:GT2 family glycosyltransferase